MLQALVEFSLRPNDKEPTHEHESALASLVRLGKTPG